MRKSIRLEIYGQVNFPTMGEELFLLIDIASEGFSCVVPREYVVGKIEVHDPLEFKLVDPKTSNTVALSGLVSRIFDFTDGQMTEGSPLAVGLAIRFDVDNS
jgi:hypothetical protein